MATHSSVLAWRIPGTAEPGLLLSMGSHGVKHDWSDASAAAANYDRVNEDNGHLLQKVSCMYCYTQCPKSCSRPPLTHTSAGYSWTLTGKSGSVSCGGHCSFLLGPGAHNVVFVLSKRLFPRPIKFWQLCGGVNGNLLQEGLCHTQVCCTQSPCPCGRPLLTHTSTGDARTQLCFSLCGVSVPWCAQGLLEPSECLWWEWGLILNMHSPLLPSCWSFSDLGHGVSPQSLQCSTAAWLLFKMSKSIVIGLWKVSSIFSQDHQMDTENVKRFIFFFLIRLLLCSLPFSTYIQTIISDLNRCHVQGPWRVGADFTLVRNHLIRILGRVIISKSWTKWTPYSWSNFTFAY